ncbi:MAG: ISL3 family transposase [Actinomycetia bacterium]|nr:ISL3 family transposase [Actinomycetes bacterium]
MAEPTSCCTLPGSYCARIDTLFNMAGVHVTDVGWGAAGEVGGGRLTLGIETHPDPVGCPECGVVATGHGRRVRRLHDIPVFGAPVQLVWRSRRYRCAEPACVIEGFTEDHALAAPRQKLTSRAMWWAISCIQRDTASVAAVARRLGVDWHTLWDAIAPLLVDLADDPARLQGVTVLGVDEHIWHHSPRPGKGPKELTGMVDLTKQPNKNGQPRTRARLLDLVPGRSGPTYAGWLSSRGPAFTDGVQIATLDPFRGYGNAIRDELQDAVAVLDAFHVVKLGLAAMEQTRRRVQQEQCGHRGRKHDPLYRIRNALRASTDKLSAKQVTRIDAGLQEGDPNYEVTVAWYCYQQLRSAFATTNLREGKKIAVKVLDSFHTCPIPEIARLGRTLRSWSQQFLAYFTTNRANNGGTEAVNGIIELHRRIARGFRNPTNYRLRMILAAGQLTHPNLR